MPREISLRRLRAIAAVVASVLLLGGLHAQAAPAATTRSLVLSDSFDGPSLSSSKWVTCYRWAAPVNGCTNATTGEEQWYQTSQAAVSGGALRLTLERATATSAGPNRAGARRAFTSGMVAATPGHAFRYGYVSVRARVPWGAGVWPAIWLLPENGGWPPEIDLMESTGTSAKVIQTAHRQGGSDAQFTFDLPDSGGWHTYGLERTPDHVEWFLDGKSTFRTDNGGLDIAMYVVINLAAGGEYAGRVPTSVSLPVTMEVDRVQVWEDR